PPGCRKRCLAADLKALTERRHRVRNRRPGWVRCAGALAVLAMIACGGPSSAQTLKAVKERGTLACGVSQGLLGFSAPDEQGRWTGFDVDFCRALAAAIFDPPAKVTFTPLSAADRFAAVRAGQIDVLSRNSTWTIGREAELGVLFAAVTYYDGQ